MLLSLGDFKFETMIPINSIKIAINAVIKSSERVQNSPVYFANSKPTTSIDITGVTLPNNGAKLNALEPLIEMIKKQQAYKLTTGYGDYLGEFIVTDFAEDRAEFLPTGEFLVQTFSMKLEKTTNK